MACSTHDVHPFSFPLPFLYYTCTPTTHSIRLPLSSKRGIDFGLGRGYSGNQAAKHFMGLVASQYAGGPGKRKRGGMEAQQRYSRGPYNLP